ncbi:MAG TPA: hypothetical protein VGL02_16370 [Streptomyces sp.]
MEDEAEGTVRTCFKCGNVQVEKTVILCNSCRDWLNSQTAGDIYAALPAR